MTEQEIKLNRMIEIIKSQGYNGAGLYYKKQINNYLHRVFFTGDYIMLDCIMNESTKIAYETGKIKVDYEELSLLIDIFHKNYN